MIKYKAGQISQEKTSAILEIAIEILREM